MLNEDRQAVVRQLRDVEQLPFATIGAHLGISRQAAWQLYQRATRPPHQRKRHYRRPKRYQ